MKSVFHLSHFLNFPNLMLVENSSSATKFEHLFNRKQLPLWSCFVFTTRNIDHNTATKSLYAHKTAENSLSWKSPYNALQAQYWKYVHRI